MMRRAYISRRTILVFILGVVACFALWHFLVAPATTKLDEALNEYDARLARVERLRNELARVQAGDTNEAALAFQDVQKLENILLPGSGKDQREFLLQYMPSLAQRYGFQEQDAAPSAPQSEGESQYIAYSYSVNGSLPAIMTFIDAIHNLPMLATVESFSISESSEGPGLWSANLSVRVWWGAYEPLTMWEPPTLDTSGQGGSTTPTIPTPSTTTPTASTPSLPVTPPSGEPDEAVDNDPTGGGTPVEGVTPGGDLGDLNGPDADSGT